jgi:hypothetical protein
MVKCPVMALRDVYLPRTKINQLQIPRSSAVTDLYLPSSRFFDRSARPKKQGFGFLRTDFSTRCAKLQEIMPSAC